MISCLKNIQHSGKGRAKARDYLERMERMARRIARYDSKIRSKYIQDYLCELSTYESVEEWSQPLVQMLASHIVLIGDFHVMSEYRRMQSFLLQRLHAIFPDLVLCVEVFPDHAQPILDLWLERRINDDELLRRTHYHDEWGFPWRDYRELYITARDLGIPIFGIDNECRNNFRRIRTRDRLMAARIADIAQRHPHHKILVVVGESHLAPSHLPRLLDDLLVGSGEVHLPLVIVFNHEALYYRLLLDRQEDQHVIRVGPDFFCIFNNNPIVKYEYYQGFLESLESDEEESEFTGVYSTFRGFLEYLAGWLGVEPKDFHLLNGLTFNLLDTLPDIYINGEINYHLDNIRQKGVAENVIHLYRCILGLQGTLFLQEGNLMLVETFNTPYGAQETGRFLFHNLKRDRLTDFEQTDWYSSFDLFYFGVLEHAAAYFCSKLLYPLRHHFIESVFLRLEAYSLNHLQKELPFSAEALYDISRFLKEHKEYELNYRHYPQPPAKILMGVLASPVITLFLQRELGFVLGEQMHQAFTFRRRYRRKVAELFFSPLDLPGLAHRKYFEFSLETIDYFDWKLIRKHLPRGYGESGLPSL